MLSLIGISGSGKPKAIVDVSRKNRRNFSALMAAPGRNMRSQSGLD
jgi:hypothetical protein